MFKIREKHKVCGYSAPSLLGYIFSPQIATWGINGLHIKGSYTTFPISMHHSGVTMKNGVKKFTLLKEGFASSFAGAVKVEQKRSDSELALASTVHMLPIGVEHLPFADLHVTGEVDWPNLLSSLSLSDMTSETLYILSSGKSYHLYGSRLFTESEWIEWLGSLLLWRRTDEQGRKWNVVDTGWVGHTIKRGYGTIRLHERSENEFQQARPEPKVVAVAEWVD